MAQANLSNSRSFIEVVRGGTMSHDSGRHQQDLARDQMTGRDDDNRNLPWHDDEYASNLRRGSTHHFNSSWREEQGGNGPRGGYGKTRAPGGGKNFANPRQGGNPNPRFGYKRGVDEREGQSEQKDVDLIAKLRRDHEQGRMGAGGGGGQCFNSNKDGHFQASCPNPPFCYNCTKDGHRDMSCPSKRGFNLRICSFGNSCSCLL
jgi:hypothetical protein